MYILQYTKSMLKLGQFLCHLVIYLYQHPRILNFWEFEPKLGQADILESNALKSRKRVARFIFIIHCSLKLCLNPFSILIALCSIYIGIHSTHIFLHQKIFSNLNGIHKNVTSCLTTAFSARNSIALSFV